MNDSDPLDIPTQTLAQEPSSLPVPQPPPPPPPVIQNSSGTIAMSVRIIHPEGVDTATLAAPLGYDPAKIEASTRASGVGYKPMEIVAREPVVGGRFEVVRAHARGGMGQVSVARDLELDREVALKEIQPRFTSDAATTARFNLEARVTGRLEHPGIVPVYGRGERSDGRPYYAMRFVSGQSLQQALDEFHEADKTPRDPMERSLALRSLLRRFMDVCNTIGYAHARGILHRDIKPANVMLGAYGETLVVDWGLAKEMKAGETKTAEVIQQNVSMPPPEAGEFDQTREGFTHYGQAMGTPAFMSPEQAAGQWDVTAVASDVYSLGAMLYAILTGAPPYSGPTREVLTKVQRGEFRPIKLVKGNVPGPLDAVCRKAMALKIEERYPTALALAADVDRWLADEPVSCYPEPWTVRAMRWAKRHRTSVAAAGVLLLTGTVALAVGLFAVNREKEETKKAYTKAAISRGEARDALLTVTDDAVGEILTSSSQLSSQQKKFLDGLIEKFEQFAAGDSDTPESQLFSANALVRIGRLQSRINRVDKATQAFNDAISKLSQTPKDANEEWNFAKGMAHLYFGILKLQHGDPAAESELKAAREIYRDLVVANPKADYRFRLSQCEDRLGVVYLTQNKMKEAGEQAEAAFTIRQQLVKDFPEEPEYQFRLAQSLRQRANSQFGQGKIKDAISTGKVAKSLLENLIKANSASVANYALLADVLVLLTESTSNPFYFEMRYGNLEDKKEESEAVGFAKQAVETWGQLLKLYPGDKDFRRKLAEANLYLAEQSIRSGNARIAIGAIDGAKTILDDLNRDDPGNPLNEDLMGDVLYTRAKIFRGRANVKAAEAANQAAKYIEKLLVQNPKDIKLLNLATACHLEKEIICRAEKRPELANAALNAAWNYVFAAAELGRWDALREYSRVFAEGLADRRADQEAIQYGERIAKLKLPPGRGMYEAAAFHCYYAEMIKLHPNWNPDKDLKLVFDQWARAMQWLKIAFENKFKGVNELESDIEFQKLRETFEYKAFLETLKQ